MLLHVFLLTVMFCLIILVINFECLLNSVVHDFAFCKRGANYQSSVQ